MSHFKEGDQTTVFSSGQPCSGQFSLVVFGGCEQRHWKAAGVQNSSSRSAVGVLQLRSVQFGSVVCSEHGLRSSIARASTHRLLRCSQDRGDTAVQSVTGVTSTTHEDYSDYTLDSDMAILRLSRALTLNDYVQPICLPSSPIPAGTNCVVTGWGETQSKSSITRVRPSTFVLLYRTN